MPTAVCKYRPRRRHFGPQSQLFRGIRQQLRTSSGQPLRGNQSTLNVSTGQNSQHLQTKQKARQNEQTYNKKPTSSILIKAMCAPGGVRVLQVEAQEPVPQRFHHEKLLQARVYVAGISQISEAHAPDRATLARTGAEQHQHRGQRVKRKARQVKPRVKQQIDQGLSYKTIPKIPTAFSRHGGYQHNAMR